MQVMSNFMMDLTVLALLVCFWSNYAASEAIQCDYCDEIQNVGTQDRDSAAVTYVLGKANTNGECNEGGEKIPTSDECKEARTARNETARFGFTSSSIVPNGCYIYETSSGTKYNWNVYSPGAARDGSTPICKETAVVDVCSGHNGVANNAGTMCCAKSCGTCGGAGCAKKDGGRKNCCGTAILKKNKKCEDVTYAPCVL